MKTNLPARRVAALVLPVLLAASAARAGQPALKAGVFDPPRPAPDFTLRGSDGKDVSLARYRGRVVLLFFGYTHCPTVCPTTLATLARMQRQLGDDAANVQIVYVTVDPAHDDVARLRDYLATVNPTFLGATGTAEELEAVRRDYGASAKQVDAARFLFNHSSSVHLIDPAGMLRAMMPYGQPAESYVHDVRVLLGRPGAGDADGGA
jgi:protein SCO1/2